MSDNRRVTFHEGDTASQLIEIRTLDPDGDNTLSGYTPHLWLRVELVWQTKTYSDSLLTEYDLIDRTTGEVVLEGFATCAGCDGDVRTQHVRIPGRDRPFCAGCVLSAFEVRPLQ